MIVEKENTPKQSIGINDKYEILTPRGWENFEGVTKNTGVVKKSVKIETESGKVLHSTENHRHRDATDRYIKCKLFSEGDSIWTVDGLEKITCIQYTELEETYDIFNTEESNTVIVNDIHTHNCDEFAFVKNSIQEEFWTSILPTISTGGDCIISSTPNGNSNLFAELWKGAKNGINEFKAMHIPWYAPPGRDEEFKRQQIGALGKRKWLQEYECRFLSSDITLLDSFVLSQIENEMSKRFEEYGGEPPIAFKIGDLEFFKKINKSLAYIVSVDVASGNGNDYSVIQVTEFPTMEQVLEFRSNNTNEKFLYSRLKNILLFLQQNSTEVYFSVENNGLGASILALYEYDENPPESSMLISDTNSKRLGLSMSENTKRGACMKLKHMVENRNYTFHSKQLLREFKGYTRQGSTFKAETGSTDDCIAALLILMRILEEMADQNPYAYDQIYNIKGQDDQQEEWDEEFTDDPKTVDDMAMPIIIG